MRAFDSLPAPLRRWMAEAALPWSPASCRRIWQRARSRGESVEAVIARLNQAQAKTLTRESLRMAPRILPPGQAALHLATRDSTTDNGKDSK